MMKAVLFPRPKQVKWLEECRDVSYPLAVKRPESWDVLDELMERFLRCEVCVCRKDPNLTAELMFAEDETLGNEAYRLYITGEGVKIFSSTVKGAFYGMVTLGQIIGQCKEQLPCCEIEDEPALPVRGYMLDISRGKVPTLEYLCQLADRLAGLKYNQLQLYVEGFSFAYPSYPQVWKDKTPITGEEIRYLDGYCQKRCIELVPNQNSLGHMSAWLEREEYRDLAESEQGMQFMGQLAPPTTMDATDPRSLDLVTSLMDDMLPFFTSDKFNINLDEPFELGKGKNKELAKTQGEASLYMDYLKRLHEQVVRRGKKMYMWGDILANHPEKIDELPDGITVLDWGYEADSPFEEHAAMLREKQIPFLLCPGTSSWTTLTGRTDNMLENILGAARAAIRHQGGGVMVTAWGDGGHLEYGIINDPGMAYAASCIWGRLDTTEEELARFLNEEVYQDRVGKAARFLLDLGRLNRYEEFPMINMTIARMNLMMGILPEGMFSMILEHSVQGILEFAPAMVEKMQRLTAEKKEFDYEGAMREINKLEEELEQMRLSGSEAELFQAEFTNALRIAKFAQQVHCLNAFAERMSPEEKAELFASLRSLGEEIIKTHPALWIARNRLHGMEESLADFKKILKQIPG